MPLHPSTQPQRRRMNRRTLVRWLKRGFLIALGLAIIGLIVYAWLPEPVAVDVGTARRMALDVEVDEDGQTRVLDRFVVSAPIGGTLERVDLDAGAQVNAGDVIGTIEPPAPALLDERTRREAVARLDAALAQQKRAETAVARARIARDVRAREAQRARALFDKDAITGSSRDDAVDAEELAIRDLAAAQSERASAAAQVAAVRAQLARPNAGEGRARVQVTAPVSGRILKVLRDSAGPIAAGTPILEIGDLSELEVVVDVLSSDGARIRPGMPVAIEAWGGQGSLAGTVKRVEPSAFTKVSALGVEEQRVNVIVGLHAPPPSLGDGFRVEARIFTWRGTNVLAIPISAVFRDHGRWAVYAIERGRARLRQVDLGHRGRLDVEVTGGLSEGDEIVLHPTDRIRDGVKVQRYRD